MLHNTVMPDLQVKAPVPMSKTFPNSINGIQNQNIHKDQFYYSQADFRCNKLMINSPISTIKTIFN